MFRGFSPTRNAHLWPSTEAHVLCKWKIETGVETVLCFVLAPCMILHHRASMLCSCGAEHTVTRGTRPHAIDMARLNV